MSGISAMVCYAIEDVVPPKDLFLDILCFFFKKFCNGAYYGKCCSFLLSIAHTYDPKYWFRSKKIFP